MEYRNLGKSGLKVSAIGLGTMTFGGRCDEAASSAIVNTALDLGVSLIDTADIYGGGLSEEYIGRAVRGRRGDAIIATKGSARATDGRYWSDASRRYMTEAVEASLRRLGTDYIDVYQVHIPDPTTPIDETLRTLDDFVRSGKVRYIACVNYRAWELSEAAWTARSEHIARYVSSQNRYNLLERGAEREIFPACKRHGMGFLPYLPLAGGLLTGKYRLGEPPPEGARLSDPITNRQMPLTEGNLAVVGRLDDVATLRGHTLLDLTMGWLLANPLIGSVIGGVTRPEQIKSNVASAEWKLSSEDLEAVEAALAAGSS